jgi:RNA recognition motif-containing protein
MPQRQPVYACFPMAFDTGLMSPPNTVRSIQQLPTGTFSGPVVQTEARKVIIKGLPRDTSEAALINLIDQFCSHSSSSRSHRSYSSSIQHVDLARHSDGRLKGHAFIIFETHRIAKKAVDAINGHKFQGRELRATLAKEGVEPAETVYQHHQQQEELQQQHGYLAPEYKSGSPSMTFAKAEERQGAALKECMDTRSDVNGERSSKPNKGKEKAGESRSEDRGAKSRPKNKDPMRGTPAVVDGSGRRRH